jgi:hypothetical protein
MFQARALRAWDCGVPLSEIRMLKTKNAPQSKVQGDKVLDAETLLKAAAKGTAGKSAAKSPFDYDGDLQAVASKILSLERQQAEIEREIALAKDELRSAVDPWYRERVKHNGYESSVRVPGTEGTTTTEVMTPARLARRSFTNTEDARESPTPRDRRNRRRAFGQSPGRRPGQVRCFPGGRAALG